MERSGWIDVLLSHCQSVARIQMPLSKSEWLRWLLEKINGFLVVLCFHFWPEFFAKASLRKPEPSSSHTNKNKSLDPKTLSTFQRERCFVSTQFLVGGKKGLLSSNFQCTHSTSNQGIRGGKKAPSNRIRTSDLRITVIFLYSPPLYQLSYRGILNI